MSTLTDACAVMAVLQHRASAAAMNAHRARLVAAGARRPEDKLHASNEAASWGHLAAATQYELTRARGAFAALLTTTEAANDPIDQEPKGRA